MNEFNFELFTGQKGKYTVAVSISKPGVLSFTSGIYRKYELFNYNGAQLLFDKAKNVIAIKLYKEQSSDMYRLKHREENKGGFIACKSFVSAYELEKYFGNRYTPQEIDYPELGKLLIIDLNEMVQ